MSSSLGSTISVLLNHQALIAAQRHFLSERSLDEQIGEPSQQVLAGHHCTAFDFRGELGGELRERRFLFIDGPFFTYRIVYDSTSRLNELVLQSLKLAD